ncbi:MAG: Na+/H+ antiporter NhaC [Lachnospiraceae bacterium]|nr:Na+/H+ antiporter NhaC [Lachnospiraceae bacterium]
MLSKIFKTKEGEKRQASLGESLFSLAFLIVCLSLGIIVFGADPHIPMFIGTFGCVFIAFKLGHKWSDIESFMMKGIQKVIPSLIILIVIGILIGMWIDAGVVPAMIYYGLKVLKPSIFYLATVIICSITSVATGSSWGTVGTTGVALMGIALGLDMSLPITAGAIVSGAYFGDKMSPLSDTTNLAPAMAGCDVMTGIRFMIFPTSISYGVTLIIFFVLGLGHSKAGADMSSVATISNSLIENFNISPIHFLPVIIVLVAVAMKVPAVPGITLGIISGAIIGLVTQDHCTLGTLLSCGMNGYVCETGFATLDNLLSTGGLMGMMYSCSMAIIAMMFGGIMEETGQLRAVANFITRKIRKPAGLVTATMFSSVIANVLMADQYISLIVPGRMYASKYKDMKVHPVCLANAIASSGAVTSVLVPWNTCGLYVSSILGISVMKFLPYAFFNYLTPIVVIILAYLKVTVTDENGTRLYKVKKGTANAA